MGENNLNLNEDELIMAKEIWKDENKHLTANELIEKVKKIKETNICNEQKLCLNSIDEFISQLYVAMHKDQLEHKPLIFETINFAYAKAKLIEYKTHCVIELSL